MKWLVMSPATMAIWLALRLAARIGSTVINLNSQVAGRIRGNEQDFEVCDDPECGAESFG